MSEPKRYHLEMHKSNDGDWVLYEEYARLKAEVERLGAFKTHTIIPNERLEVDLENCRIALRVKYEEVAKFKAEVERLTADNEQLQNRCDFLEGKQP
jgi:3-phenylpropionate/cinnamic acid dioxygenase small subunit